MNCTVNKEINVVCCVGAVQIQIEIEKGRCTAMDTIRIGSTPTFFYLVYFLFRVVIIKVGQKMRRSQVP